MQISQILFYILIVFAGYAVGRVSHIYAGHIKSPHHWIYGLVLIIPGFFFDKYLLGIMVLCFGLGLFISDLKDFLKRKFWGPDEINKKNFWGID